MKKIIVKNAKILTAFVIGIIVSGVVVYAATSIDAKQVAYSSETVEDALDDLYGTASEIKTIKKFCQLKSGTAGTIGAKYECDPGDGVKRNFYVLAVNNDNTIDLIMEKNITQGSSKTTMTWMDAMKYFDTGAGASTKAAWVNVMDLDLPKAQDIANAVGNTAWRMEDKNYDGWFCFGTGYNQSCGGNSGTLKNDSQTLKFNWLFNYTRECANSGCDSTTSLGDGEAYGYWTRDIVAQQKDSTSRAWTVTRDGGLRYGPVSYADYYGVRPVITVSKSNLYELASSEEEIVNSQ